MQEGMRIGMVEFGKLHLTRLSQSIRRGGQRPTPSVHAILRFFCAAKKTPDLTIPHVKSGVQSHDQHDFTSVFSVSRIKNCRASLRLARPRQRSGSVLPLFGDIVERAIDGFKL